MRKLSTQGIKLLRNYHFYNLLSIYYVPDIPLSISHILTHFIPTTNLCGRLPSAYPFVKRLCNQPKVMQAGSGHFKAGI